MRRRLRCLPEPFAYSPIESQSLGVSRSSRLKSLEHLTGLVQRIDRSRQLAPVGCQRELLDDEHIVRHHAPDDGQQTLRRNEVTPFERCLNLVHESPNRRPGCGVRTRIRSERCTLGFRLGDGRRLEILHERVNRAVARGLRTYGLYGLLQLAAHALHLAEVDALTEMMIGPNGNLTHVKGEYQLVFGDGDGRIWFE